MSTVLTLASSSASEVIMWPVIGGIVFVAIIGHTVRSIVSSVQREKSRREIAAYIAEGSMSADQGQKLMAAETPQRKA